MQKTGTAISINFTKNDNNIIIQKDIHAICKGSTLLKLRFLTWSKDTTNKFLGCEAVIGNKTGQLCHRMLFRIAMSYQELHYSEKKMIFYFHCQSTSPIFPYTVLL